MAAIPDTVYARDGDGHHLAYQIASESGPDLLFVPTGTFSIDLLWDDPTVASHLRRLGSFSRLILTDLAGAARCDSGNPATMMARTTKSLLVVCQAGPDNFYYRGTRLSDGASLELPNAVRNGDGWSVTNPADGTVYLIRPDQLTISRGVVSEAEPMVQYASS